MNPAAVTLPVRDTPGTRCLRIAHSIFKEGAMLKRRKPYSILVAMMSLLLCVTAQASVVVSGTRVVFPSNEKEVTVRLTNEGRLPSLVQTWIDSGDQTAAPEKIDVPFVMTPTIFRLEQAKSQTLRIIYSGEPLPADKESLFWLNVLEVPPKAVSGDDDDRNRLQFAFRTRIKLMYRPDGLPGHAEDAPGQLKWEMSVNDARQRVLKATNKTPYIVNLGSVVLHAQGKTFDAGVGYVLPGESKAFPVEGLNASGHIEGTVEFSSINDWGGSHANKAALTR